MNNIIKNPLLCDSNIRRIIEYYFKTNTFEQFSKSIKNHASYANYEENDIDKYAIEQFIGVLHNYWQTQIINCSMDKFPYDKYKINESDLLYLKGYLICDSENKSDEYSINNIQSKRLDEILSKFTYLNKKVDYKNINSYDFYIDQVYDLDGEYIVTLNIKSRTLLFKILTKYVKICLDNKKAFNFKFSQKLNDDNTIIIYTDKNNLDKTINILNNIRKNDKELDASLRDVVKEPPILYGIVDDWIGVRQIDDNYYDTRIKCLYDSIDLVVSNWYDNLLKNKKSQYTNKTYKDVLDEDIKRYFYHELNNLCLNSVKNHFLKKKLDGFIENILLTKYEELDEYIFNISKDCNIKINKNDIKKKLYTIIGEIYRNDKDFLGDIMNAILMYSKKYNIDSKHFYLDNSASKMLFDKEDTFTDLEEFLLDNEEPKEKVLNRKYLI